MQSLMGETPKTLLHRFLTESNWSDYEINERRLEIMNKCSQTLVKHKSNKTSHTTIKRLLQEITKNSL